MSPAQPAYKHGYEDNSLANGSSGKVMSFDEFPNQSYRHQASNPRINRQVDMEDWREDQPVAKQELSLQLDDASFGTNMHGYNTSDYADIVEEDRQPDNEFVAENGNTQPHYYQQPSHQPQFMPPVASSRHIGADHASAAAQVSQTSVGKPTNQSQYQELNGQFNNKHQVNNQQQPYNDYHAAPAGDENWQSNEQGEEEGWYDEQNPEQVEDSYEANVPQFLQGQPAAEIRSQAKSSSIDRNWRRILISSAIGAVLLIIVAVIAWPGSQSTPLNPDALPIVTADATPIKIQAAEANNSASDLQIYQGISGVNSNPDTIETLLPGPENPLNPGQNANNVNNGNPGNASNNVNTGDGSNPVSIMADIPPLKPLQNAGSQTAAVNNNNSVQVGSGIYYAQVASVRTPDGAQAAAAKFERDLGSALGGVKMQVKKVDLGADKGVTYRVVAGPVADRNAANVLCQNIKNKGQDCIIAAMP